MLFIIFCIQALIMGICLNNAITDHSWYYGGFAILLAFWSGWINGKGISELNRKDKEAETKTGDKSDEY